MRVAVLSDTHDKLPEHVVTGISAADEVWHLGDVCSERILARLEKAGRSLRVVRGNCDSVAAWPEFLDLAVEGTRMRLIHIPPRKPPPEIDVILHGHTHVPRNEVFDGVRYLNPGCITRPNRGARASYAWLELRADQPLRWKLVPI